MRSSELLLLYSIVCICSHTEYTSLSLKLNEREQNSIGPAEKVYTQKCFDTRKGTSETRSEGRTEIPFLQILVSRQHIQRPIQLRDCEISEKRSKCNATYEVSKKGCSGKVSFAALLSQYFPNIDVSFESLGIIQPEKFDVTGFNIDSCSGVARFHALGRERLDIIPNKLQIKDAQLSLVMSYYASTFCFSGLEFEIKGNMLIGNEKYIVTAMKPFEKISIQIAIYAKSILLKDFVSLFTSNDIMPSNVPKSLSKLTSSTMKGPFIKGGYYHTGSFEFILAGRPEISDFFKDSVLYLVIQKTFGGKMLAAILLHFQSVSLKTLLTNTVNKELPPNTLMVDDTKSSCVIEISKDNIYVIRNNGFNDVFRFFVTRGNSVNKGVHVKVEFPFHAYVSRQTPDVSLQGLPLYLYLMVKFTNTGLRINFLTDIQLTIDRIVRIFLASTNSIPQDVLAQVPGQFRLQNIDLTYAGGMSLNFVASRVFLMIRGLLTISEFQLSLEKQTSESKWSLSGKGKAFSANTTIDITLRQQKEGYYSLLGKADSLSSGSLIRSFEGALEVDGLLERFHMFNFEIEDSFFTAKLGPNLFIRLTGKPHLQNGEKGYVEGMIFDINRRPTMIFGIVTKQIHFDDFMENVYGFRPPRASWMTSVNVGVLLSTLEGELPNKDMVFNLVELKNMPLKKVDHSAVAVELEVARLIAYPFTQTFSVAYEHNQVWLFHPEAIENVGNSITIKCEVSIPQNCVGYGLCELLRRQMKEKKDLELHGNIYPTQMKLEGNPVSFPLSNNINIENFILKITARKQLFFIEAVAKLIIKEPRIEMKGQILSQGNGAVSVDMVADGLWTDPFGLKFVSLVELRTKLSIVPGKPLPNFELNADLQLGLSSQPMSGHSQPMHGSAYVIIHPEYPNKSYLYSLVKFLNINVLARAFDIVYKLPEFIQHIAFLSPAVISYASTSEAAQTLTQIKELNINMQTQVTIQGVLMIFSYSAKYAISIESKALTMEAQLPNMVIGRRLVNFEGKSQANKDMGPKLNVKISQTSAMIQMEGIITTLGISSESIMTICDHGFSFSISGRLFNIYETKLNVAAPFGNLLQVDFEVTGCLSSLIQEVTQKVASILHKTNTETRDILSASEKKANIAENIYSNIHSKIKAYKEQIDNYKRTLDEEVKKIEVIEKEIKTPCDQKCNKVCMGAPGWTSDQLKFEGSFIGAPTWIPCKSKAADINCMVRCLGKRVIHQVRASEKQQLTQGLLTSLNTAEEERKLTEKSLGKANQLVRSTVEQLENINKKLEVGINVARDVSGKKVSEIIKLNNICFKGNLIEASTSKVTFYINGTLQNKPLMLVIHAGIDLSLTDTLSRAIAEQVRSGINQFREAVYYAWTSLGKMQKDKDRALSDIEKEYQEQKMEAMKKDNILKADKEHFQSVAYGDIPQLILNDDRTIDIFKKLSPWVMIANNDPFEEHVSKKKSKHATGVKKEDIIKNGTNSANTTNTTSTPCSRLEKDLKEYNELVTVMSEFAESYVKEKITSLKSKNRRFAELRDVEDQLKSDCYLQNCTADQLNDALFFAGRAREGTQKWSEEVHDQIEKQNREALSLFANKVGSILEKNKGEALGAYLLHLNERSLKAMKRAAISHAKLSDVEKSENKLDAINNVLQFLLVNENTITMEEAVPKIFNMKRRFKSLHRRTKNSCKMKDNPGFEKDNLGFF